MAISGLGDAPPPVRPECSVGPTAVEPALLVDEDFERLREILVGAERRELEAARSRIADLESTQIDLPQRLPAALESLRVGNDSTRIANALAEPVGQALGTAVRKNPQTLVDALFPIIGPLIRKAMAEALRTLVADLNSAVESSFTPRGIKWRFEAWRAGVPYAQVVLKHRLAYRIDHVFLIERGSGLVLQRESAPDLPELDADAIAGMLTALGDFVSDSVGTRGSDTLDSVRVGEHVVWVVPGPWANLASFMRGVPPAQLHGLLEQRLEDIHAQFSAEPDGDLRCAGNLALRHELLQPETLLREAVAAAESEPKTSPKWPLLLALLLIGSAIGSYAISRERWNMRIDALRAQLSAHPGFVLTGIDSRPWREVTVRGLIDPDAAPLASVVRAAHLGSFEPRIVTTGYLSSDDAVVVLRAERLLAPPGGVRLSVAQGVLTITGDAPAAWIDSAREHAQWIAGVARVEWETAPQQDLAVVARAQLQVAVDALAKLGVTFGDATAATSGSDSVDAIASAARHAIALAAIAKVDLAFTSIGTTDELGSATANARLRTDRARWLALALAARGISRVEVDSGDQGRDVARRGAFLGASVEALSK